ncbi:MAG: DUF1800 family protein [Actinobacteria bacterium]|nr:DUF1800 family protein [Actinomycetota bacterium]
MLLWLDGAQNRAENPNENFAREFLELFTLGQGHYTETDVREAARAFTGWGVRGADRDALEFSNRSAVHDAGVKTFLGQTGRWQGQDIVRIAVAHPATGRFIAGKLFDLFAYPDAPTSAVEPFAEKFRATGGNIREVVRAILLSAEFSSDQAYRARVKSPVELAVGTLKAVQSSGIPEWTWRRLRRIGQELFSPPNVGGWTAGVGWLNQQTVIERLAFAAQLAHAPGETISNEALLGGVSAAQVRDDPGAVVDQFLLLFDDGRLGATARDVLVDYLRIDGADAATTRFAVVAAQRLRGLVQLILSAPLSHVG